MAVIIEGLTVVVRIQSIRTMYKDGLEAFIKAVPNATLCADGELAAVSFSSPEQVDTYLLYLKRQGLIYRENDLSDIVVADQIYGLRYACEWVEFKRIYWNHHPQAPIAICQARPSSFEGVATPVDWEYEQSLSRKVRYLDGVAVPKEVTLLRIENEMDVLQDHTSGDIYYVPLRMRL